MTFDSIHHIKKEVTEQLIPSVLAFVCHNVTGGCSYVKLEVSPSFVSMYPLIVWESYGMRVKAGD